MRRSFLTVLIVVTMVSALVVPEHQGGRAGHGWHSGNGGSQDAGSIPMESAAGVPGVPVELAPEPSTTTEPPTTTTEAPPITTRAPAPSPAPVPAVQQWPVSLQPCGGDLPPCWVKQRESHGDYSAVSPDGLYRGAWQFAYGTWGGFGGYAYANEAPPEVQDARARQVWAGGAGCGHWGAC